MPSFCYGLFVAGTLLLVRTADLGRQMGITSGNRLAALWLLGYLVVLGWQYVVSLRGGHREDLLVRDGIVLSFWVGVTWQIALALPPGGNEVPLALLVLGALLWGAAFALIGLVIGNSLVGVRSRLSRRRTAESLRK